MAVLALLCACGANAARDPDELVMLLPRDVQEVDPRFVSDAYGHKVSRLVFASLVTLDPMTLEVVPDLAEEVTAVSPTEYRVVLRSNLVFSDGSALDAEDVVATFRSVVDPLMQARYAPTYRRIARIDAPDARTVVFHIDGPHATFLTDLELPILRAEDAARRVGVVGQGEPIGAGPYRLIGREAGRIDLRANAHWHRGVPRIAKVRMLVVRDDNIRALRMLAGAGDLALNAIPAHLLPLLARDGLSVRTARGIGTTYLGVNMQAPGLADARVRRALAYAIDRDALVSAKLGGHAVLARTPIPPGHWAYAPSTPDYDYDPVRARSLLASAGITGNSPLRVSLRCGADRFRLSIARAIAAMFRQVGVEADVRPSETATLLHELDRGRFDLALLQLPELIEPHVLTWFFGADHVPGERREGANRWRFRDRDFDAAMESGRKSIARGERIEAYRRAQDILARELPVISLWHEDVIAVGSARAAQFTVPRDGRFATLAL